MTKRNNSFGRVSSPVGKLAGACLLASSLLAGGVNAQPNMEDVEIKSYHVQGNIWMIYGAGGNVTVQIGDEGILIVDTTFAETAPAVLEEIRRIAGPEPIIRYVLNTHVHGDHTGGNQVMAAAGHTIVAGNEARDVGDTGAEVMGHENVMLSMATNDVPFELWPSEVYLGDQYDLYFNGEPIEILYQGRAHTNTDSMVFFRKSDVISTGDVYVTNGYPFVDTDNFGHINGIIDSLNEIIRITVPRDQQEAGTYVIPGHGRISDEADVVEYRDMITIIRDRVQHMVDEGMSLEEVLGASPSSDYDGRYGNGFVSPESFITAIYNNLSE